jgi:hypothetical protein
LTEAESNQKSGFDSEGEGCREKVTPYTPCPGEQRDGCSDIDDANEAGDESCNIEGSYAIAENTEALEKRSASRFNAEYT